MTIELRISTDVRGSEKVLEFEPVFFGNDSRKSILEQVEKLMHATKWHKIEIINTEYLKK